MLAAASLAIDLGLLYVGRSEAQRAADAAALAGASAFVDSGCTSMTGGCVAGGTQETLARQEAETVGAQDSVMGQAANIEDGDISFNYPTPMEPQVSVTVQRSAARGNAIPMLFSRLFGVTLGGVAATATDRYIPATYTPRMADLPPDLSFHDLKPPHLQESDLALPILRAGLKMAGSTPVLLFNEPMFISQGKNSNLRYNFYYPRWAYDDFRQIMQAESQREGWNYQDDWDVVPASEFTNSAVHMTPKGEAQFAKLVAQRILTTANQP